MTNTRSTGNGTSSTTNIRSSTGMYTGATRTNVKPSLPITQQQLDDENIIQKIFDEFILPFRQGLFWNINNKNFNTYVTYLNNRNYKNNITLTFIMESMFAALFSKQLYSMGQICKQQKSQLDQTIIQLHIKISELEGKIYQLEQTDISGDNINICLKAEASSSLNMLPIIARYVNINLAWYYWFFGYNPNVAPSPDDLIFVNNHVAVLGTSIIPSLGMSNALYQLVLLINNS